MSMYKFIQPYRSISIVGMEKNTGKTETLNKIIQETGSKKILGLNSIGRDGEELDAVTSTAKPRIYIFSGTLIATARECLKACDITKEILYSTGIFTPLGEIIILRALSDGFIELAGGSYNAQNIYITKKMQELGCDHVIIDGALDRNSSSVISEAVILATGAAVSPDINIAVKRTVQQVQSMLFPCVSSQEKEAYTVFFETETFGSINYHGNITPIPAKGIIGIQNIIKEYLNEETKAILIKSALTDSLIENIIKHRKNFAKIECIIMDGTKCFISLENYQKALICGIKFKVIKPINLICVTVNPYSPKGGYYFDKQKFQGMLQGSISVPVINVRELNEFN